MISIQLERAANRKMATLPVHDRRKVERALQTLQRFPNCQHITKLRRDTNMFRLRVGSHRVLFRHSTEKKQISICDVLRRDSRTY
ncbi:hypothetical protein PsAD37_03315 [Pseudovibrio sp. Ad37]|nr:hypothetical protein PsAD37_03315 [Pseudovibrio sp. Ad37]